MRKEGHGVWKVGLRITLVPHKAEVPPMLPESRGRYGVLARDNPKAEYICEDLSIALNFSLAVARRTTHSCAYQRTTAILV